MSDSRSYQKLFHDILPNNIESRLVTDNVKGLGCLECRVASESSLCAAHVLGASRQIRRRHGQEVCLQLQFVVLFAECAILANGRTLGGKNQQHGVVSDTKGLT